MKRGLSTVVETVLLISLTVIVAALLASFAIPFVRENLAGSTSCVPVQNYYSFDSSLHFNCYTATSYKLSVAERADQGGADKVVGFNLVLGGSDGSGVSLQARNETGLHLIGLTSAVYPGLPGGGNTKTYRFDSSVRYTQASIYAVLASGKSCEQQGGTVTLRQC